MRKIDEIKNFAQFLNETQIGYGSSRNVFDDGIYVIKKAYVPIGIFQNENEVNLSIENDVNDILNIVIDYSSDFSWIRAKKAKLIAEDDIEKYIPCFWDMEKYLNDGVSFSNKCNKKMDSDYFIQKLVLLKSKYNLKYRDLTNHKNYGLVNGEIKLIDFGLTTLYDKSKYEKLM
jgi:hypothetical protein